MSLVTVSNITHHFVYENLFENITFTIDFNSKIGLIGKNGSGKSTLFKMINKEIEPISGNVFIAKGTKIVYLKQDPDFDSHETLYDFVLDSAQEYNELKKQLRDAELAVSNDHSKQNIKRLSDLQHLFETKDYYNFESKMENILVNLHFPKSTWNQSIHLFSGGERTRIQLAKGLLERYDLLLLDEPTNHLDLEMIYWLERFLKGQDKPYVIISHDREFLDKTVDKILEIKNKKIYMYKGNYSAYEIESKRLDELQQKQYEEQLKFIKKEQDFIMKNIAGQKTNQAKGRLKRLNRLERIEKVASDKDVTLKIKAIHRSGNDVFRFENVSFGYDKPLISNFSNLIKYQDRIAILGNNGCGKTTLLKILNGEHNIISGDFKVGASLKIGYYDQMHIKLDETLTVESLVRELNPEFTKGEIYTYLAKFGFYEEDWNKLIGSLSGGEKGRLYLAKLIFEMPNVLILDEPTNHLDMRMISSLEEALLDYDGTIIFVSHDRAFIKKIATRFLMFEDKKINEIFSDFDEIFENKIMQKKKSEKPKLVKRENTNKRVNPFLIKRMEETIERKTCELQDLKEILKEKEFLFSDPQTFKNNEKLLQLNKEIAEIKKTMEHLEAEIDSYETEYLEMIDN